MSQLIVGDQLEQLLGTVIINGSAENVEGIKYDFCLSDRFLKSKHQVPVEISSFGSPTESENYSVDPGETVFVLSEEDLDLPFDIKAELSHKRRMSHEGIQVLGGFCIDPGYKGKLVFGIYNYSSRPFVLVRGRKLIAAQFYRLTGEEIADLPTPQSLTDFPDDVIQIAKGLKPISLVGIENRLGELQLELSKLREDFDRKEEWFEKFQESMGALQDSVTDLKSSLSMEMELRKTGEQVLQEELSKRDEILSKMQATMNWQSVVNSAGKWLLLAICAVVLAIILARLGVVAPK